MIGEAHNPAQPFTSVARAKNLFKVPSKPSKVAELAPTPPLDPCEFAGALNGFIGGQAGGPVRGVDIDSLRLVDDEIYVSKPVYNEPC